jgi:hypothetical protein
MADPLSIRELSPSSMGFLSGEGAQYEASRFARGQHPMGTPARMAAATQLERDKEIGEAS